MHNLYSKDQQVLQLVIYYDELVVCNPLVALSGIHKRGEFLEHTCTYILGPCISHVHMLTPPLQVSSTTLLAIYDLSCVQLKSNPDDSMCKKLLHQEVWPILHPFIDDAKILATVRR